MSNFEVSSDCYTGVLYLGMWQYKLKKSLRKVEKGGEKMVPDTTMMNRHTQLFLTNKSNQNT
jgi:hypothetical protein